MKQQLLMNCESYFSFFFYDYYIVTSDLALVSKFFLHALFLLVLVYASYCIIWRNFFLLSRTEEDLWVKTQKYHD